jgi:SAM-dependent methyltransferase
MALPFDEGAFDAVISSHALLFADDRVGALREWRRVCRAGGRLSLSPVATDLADWARAAGWRDAAVSEDPSVVIRLPDADAFTAWRLTGSRGAATAGWSEERQTALTADMLAVTPRDADGAYAIPFGAMYLTATT